MTLTTAINAYVALKRSLGAVFSAQHSILRSFARTIGDVPLEQISSQACDTFCRGAGPATRFWENKHQVLRGFFGYLQSRNHIAASPLREPGPRADRSFRPYIYSHQELQSLLDATRTLSAARFPLQPLTYRTLVLVLYGAGLRAGEGLRLRCCDVDLHQRLLSIWNTKFFKSRLVPIGTELCTALEKYRQQRELLPQSGGSRSAFFAARSGEAISLQRLEKVFARLREHADYSATGHRSLATPSSRPEAHDGRTSRRRLVPRGRRCPGPPPAVGGLSGPCPHFRNPNIPDHDCRASVRGIAAL